MDTIDTKYIRAYTWTFDAPTGVYFSPECSNALLREVVKPGLCYQYGAVRTFRALENLSSLQPDSPVQDTLIRQARLLRQMFPLVTPHLRLAIPLSSRGPTVVWYDPAFEGVLLEELSVLPTLNPVEAR
jgi:hypothetical protein